MVARCLLAAVGESPEAVRVEGITKLSASVGNRCEFDYEFNFTAKESTQNNARHT
jgi:hypothetical protein